MRKHIGGGIFVNLPTTPGGMAMLLCTSRAGQPQAYMNWYVIAE